MYLFSHLFKLFGMSSPAMQLTQRPNIWWSLSHTFVDMYGSYGC